MPPTSPSKRAGWCGSPEAAPVIGQPDPGRATAPVRHFFQPLAALLPPDLRMIGRSRPALASAAFGSTSAVLRRQLGDRPRTARSGSEGPDPAALATFRSWTAASSFRPVPPQERTRFVGGFHSASATRSAEPRRVPTVTVPTQCGRTAWLGVSPAVEPRVCSPSRRVPKRGVALCHCRTCCRKGRVDRPATSSPAHLEPVPGSRPPRKTAHRPIRRIPRARRARASGRETVGFSPKRLRWKSARAATTTRASARRTTEKPPLRPSYVALAKYCRRRPTTARKLLMERSGGRLAAPTPR